MIRYSLVFLFFFLTTGMLRSDPIPYFDWSPLAVRAYEKATELRLREAENLIRQLEENEPDNLIATFLSNYLDFFRIYIHENEAEFDRLESNKDNRLDQLRTGDPESPWYLYTQANIRLQWALARLKFEEYATAFFEVNKAFKLLKRNQEKFPDFMPNRKDLGILHAISGTIPDGYKWAVTWLSNMEGSIAQGQRELEEVIEYARHEDFIFEKEIYIFYAYLMLHLNQNEEAAWSIINSSKLDPAGDPLACFIVANIAMRTGRNDDAIDLLQHRPGGRVFLDFPYLDYMLGLSKLRRLDPDADTYFLRYIDQFQGRNFIKDAYQKLAWNALLRGDEAGYRSFMRLCANSGYTIVGSDVSAQRAAESRVMPDPNLLRARLLFDGGYYEQAEKLLKAIKVQDYTKEEHHLEYNYRMGRVYHLLKREEAALYFYQLTIDRGAYSTWYYACRAALESGLILEAQDRIPEAREAFEQALQINPAEHATGLHHAAKAGLARLKER